MIFTLDSLFQVRSDERVTFVRSFLLFFCLIGASVAVGRTVAYTIFLSKLSPRLFPILFILSAGIGVVTTLLYARFLSRLRLDRLISCTYFLLGIAFLSIWFAQRADANDFYLLMTLVLLVDVALNLGTLQFWSLRSDPSPRPSATRFPIPRSPPPRRSRRRIPSDSDSTGKPSRNCSSPTPKSPRK
ncbi:hypothetical protein Pan216_32260 [Planctomycetes bacterium Pan216]|uniref:Uncharacterized protein n=1 Tax=Kolteria novifilia TaxID=2527975 RepID=A0A518B5V3_9BACT|nr:hypothetical protein Pan216_32260 [Planctomycetes bacterium Pan216]